jgi:hypothetical protein
LWARDGVVGKIQRDVIKRTKTVIGGAPIEEGDVLTCTCWYKIDAEFFPLKGGVSAWVGEGALGDTSKAHNDGAGKYGYRPNKKV